MPHFVITGPDVEANLWGFPDINVFVIGRSPTCALVLVDPKGKISRVHAAVVRFSNAGELYFIRDLGSRDSTRVAGENCYQRILRDGDRIDIGDYRLLFRREATARTALPRLRVVASKKLDSGPGGETTVSRDYRAVLRADAAGQEILEQFERLSDHGSSMVALFREFMPRILGYLDADRGFVARFISSDAREFEEIASFGLGIEERIDIADPSYIDRILLSEIVDDDSTLLIPIASARAVRGFFCVDRRTVQSKSFPSERTAFALRIGELAAQCCWPTGSRDPQDQFSPDTDVKAWPQGLIGVSKPIKDLSKEIASAAKARRNVLLLGETGTGKELVADELHRLAFTQSNQAMVKRDCAAIPESLAETALFGSEKGAFTGSVKVVPGMFEVAHGSSLFLDEIQALPIALQHKLFRVLLEKKVVRVGSQEAKGVDVFVVAAIMTTPNPDGDVSTLERALLERFGLRIKVPPLRDRREDIPLLVFQFIDSCAAAGSKIRSISRGALELLMNYPWPGNVRELKNLIENSAMRDTEIILSSDLPPTITCSASRQVDSSGETRPSGLRTLAEIEKEAIQMTLSETGGNIAKTARILQIAEMTVRNKMTTYDIPIGYGRSQK